MASGRNLVWIDAGVSRCHDLVFCYFVAVYCFFFFFLLVSFVPPFFFFFCFSSFCGPRFFFFLTRKVRWATIVFFLPRKVRWATIVFFFDCQGTGGPGCFFFISKNGRETLLTACKKRSCKPTSVRKKKNYTTMKVI